MAVISMKSFLEAGVHFGHQTKRWNPKMLPYIYGTKSGIHIIDLRKTLKKLQEAYQFAKDSSENGLNILFVGTKQSLQKIILEEADRCKSPYINFRWLGGFLTNFSTVKQSINRLQHFEEMAGEDKSYDGMLKKEALQIERKREKLERSLGGVRSMKDLPGLIFIIDCKREHLAVREARKLGIPIIGIADTNCDPTEIDYVIPGNDDSPKAVQLFTSVIATAILEGKKLRKESLEDLKLKDSNDSEEIKKNIISSKNDIKEELNKDKPNKIKNFEEKNNKKILKDESSIKKVEKIIKKVKTIKAIKVEDTDIDEENLKKTNKANQGKNSSNKKSLNTTKKKNKVPKKSFEKEE